MAPLPCNCAGLIETRTHMLDLNKINLFPKSIRFLFFSEILHYDSFHAAFAALIRCLLKDLVVYLCIYLKVAGNLNLKLNLS